MLHVQIPVEEIGNVLWRSSCFRPFPVDPQYYAYDRTPEVTPRDVTIRAVSVPKVIPPIR